MDNNTAPENKATILIVDDLPANLTLLGNILKDDYKLKATTSGEKAVAIAETSLPDLILLDVVMPGIDGYEACRRIKKNPATSKIPVIFVSARNEELDELSGFELGAVDYITKPVCPSIVLARVKTHLALTAAVRELEKQNAVLSENVRLREEIEKITRHDLKAPLIAFVNIPEMLMRDAAIGPGHREMLGILSKSANRMLEMINRSLDICRMEQGTYRLVSVPVNMVRVIYQIFQQYNRQAAFKDVKCSLFFEGGPVAEDAAIEFAGEEFLFFSMLSNLIKNAIEASPERGEVKVEITGHPAPGVSVNNAGLIAAQVRDRIFQRYATFGKERGTGLGVYSARLMARTLGGDLDFQTSESGGTTFTVTLGSAARTASVSAGAAAPQGPQKSRAEIKILVVDDSSYMRLIVKDILRKEGFLSILEAEDGEKAISVLREGGVDLVLCDWNMPGLTGLDVLEFMQGVEALKRVPFIMITASATMSEIEKAAARGVRNYIAKPFSPDLLSNKVKAVLEL